MEDETKNETAQQQEPAPEPQAKTYSEEDYNALQAKLDAVTGQLNDANSKIQSYTEMDIDGIKQSAADWQKKYEAAQNQMQQMEYSAKLDKFVAQQGCRNPIYADYLKFQFIPSAWRETWADVLPEKVYEFQSTPSVWRETQIRQRPLPPAKHFNPLPPYGGRPVEVFPFVRRNCISIHSLRMEGDSAV